MSVTFCERKEIIKNLYRAGHRNHSRKLEVNLRDSDAIVIIDDVMINSRAKSSFNSVKPEFSFCAGKEGEERAEVRIDFEIEIQINSMREESANEFCERSKKRSRS